MSRTRPDLWLGLLLAVACAPGCMPDQFYTTKGAPPAAPAPGKPCEVAIAWINRVQSAPDVVHDGRPTPCLVGRMYLFDQTEKFPVVGDGAVLVTLYDDTRGPATQPLEEWYIDPVALRKFLKKDVIGWGYSLFLPWGSCKPEVTKVHLTCKYEPASGQPLFGPVSPLTLEHVPSPAVAPVAAQQLPMPTQVR
jgi:hypothetical protein